LGEVSQCPQEKVFERKVDAKETDNQGKDVKYSMKDKRKSAPETVSVLKEHLQTAISSTDGTNVLNKIDTAIENTKMIHIQK
jgi:hypothetical protein